jgi:hypothetical protein
MPPADADYLLGALDSQIQQDAAFRLRSEALSRQAQANSQVARERFRRLLERYGSDWLVDDQGGATARLHENLS